MTQTAPQAASTLGISLFNLYALMANPAFPTPVSNDGAGNIVFANADISGFATKMAACVTEGWVIAYPYWNNAPWTPCSTTPAGIYPQPRAVLGLFD